MPLQVPGRIAFVLSVLSHEAAPQGVVLGASVQAPEALHVPVLPQTSPTGHVVPQQTPTTQWPELHCISAVQLSPLLFLVQVPSTQLKSFAQSVMVLHDVLQDIMVASQA